MLKSDNLGNLLGCAESGTLGREGEVGSEEYFLGLPLTGGWDHLGPGGRGGEEGAQEGEGGKGTLGGRGGWQEEEREEGEEEGGGTEGGHNQGGLHGREVSKKAACLKYQTRHN